MIFDTPSGEVVIYHRLNDTDHINEAPKRPLVQQPAFHIDSCPCESVTDFSDFYGAQRRRLHWTGSGICLSLDFQESLPEPALQSWGRRRRFYTKSDIA